MIDWKHFAKINNLTEEEFKTEIYTVAAVVGIMDIEKSDGDMLKFTTSDNGGIVMTVRRKEQSSSSNPKMENRASGRI